MMSDLTKLGVLAIPVLLIAFGEFLKYQGVAPRWVAVVNLFLGLIISVVYRYLMMPIDAARSAYLADTILIGLAIGLASAGFYSVTRSFGVSWLGGTRAYEARIFEARHDSMGVRR